MQSHSIKHHAAGIAWALAFVYLLSEILTALAWKSNYSFRHDTISDLGVTACTPNMCSPLHLLMNATFVVLGLLTIVGAVLFRHFVPHGYRQWSIVWLAVITGVSTAATGLFPSNDGIVVHFLAVMPAFVSRHIVLILLAIFLWKQRRLVAVWSAICALTGLVGAVLLMTSVQIGITERLVLYPLPAFMAVTGLAVLLTSLTRTITTKIRPPIVPVLVGSGV